MGAQNTHSSSMCKGLGVDLRHPHAPVMGIFSLGQSPSSQQGQMIGSEPPGGTGGFKTDVCSSMKSHCWYWIRDIFFSPNTSGQMGLKSSGVLWDHLNGVRTVVFSTWLANLDVSISVDAPEISATGTLHPYAFQWMWLVNKCSNAIILMVFKLSQASCWVCLQKQQIV